MKNVALVPGFLLLMLMASCQQNETSGQTQQTGQVEQVTEQVTPTPEQEKRKIQLAILLDTSGSMRGLIEQTKNQLWKMVNQLAKAKDANGADPEIELALYMYGNDDTPAESGFIKQVSGFTTELDEISEKLFELRTNGSVELCGTVIKNSLAELEWSKQPEDLQLIFIAGNESFKQGKIDYKNACLQANENHVIVNTIFCGNYNEGIKDYWKHGADLGKGKYMNIDQNTKIIHIDSPYDHEITQLNTQFNDTYIPYGRLGYTKKQKQLKEDRNASSYGNANAVKRIVSKGSKVYKNTSWDLVDAYDQKGFDIKKVDVAGLPKEMRDFSDEEKLNYIKRNRAERMELKAKLSALNKKREHFIAEYQAKQMATQTLNLDDVIVSTIIEQAKSKSFSFEDEIN